MANETDETLRFLALLTLNEGILSGQTLGNKPIIDNSSPIQQRYRQRILTDYRVLSTKESPIESKAKDLGYFLDLMILNDQLICFYLGKINETLVLDGHSFYMTYSKAKGTLGAPYPISLQPNPITPYTRGNQTWIDSRVPVILDSTTPTILDQLDPSVLGQIKVDGEINYRTLNANKSIEVH